MGGKRYAGRKCDSRATKTGSRRLELIGLGDIGTEGLSTEKQMGIWQGRPWMRFTREAYVSLSKEGKSATGQRSNRLNYVPSVFLTVIGSPRITGFPQVQSFRMRRSFQPHRTRFRA